MEWIDAVFWWVGAGACTLPVMLFLIGLAYVGTHWIVKHQSTYWGIILMLAQHRGMSRNAVRRAAHKALREINDTPEQER